MVAAIVNISCILVRKFSAQNFLQGENEYSAMLGHLKVLFCKKESGPLVGHYFISLVGTVLSRNNPCSSPSVVQLCGVSSVCEASLTRIVSANC